MTKNNKGKGNVVTITKEEFVKKAIVNLRGEKYKGIHSVYSKFNDAFRKFFPDACPVETVRELSEQGKIYSHPVGKGKGKIGGVMLYLPEDAPAKKSGNGEKAVSDALAKILG